MTEEKNDGGPAFPYHYHPNGIYPDRHVMSLRDWFAGMALQAIVAKTPVLKGSSHELYDGVYSIADGAYHYADAMLEASK